VAPAGAKGPERSRQQRTRRADRVGRTGSRSVRVAEWNGGTPRH
jgi:hypothetical protein